MDVVVLSGPWVASLAVAEISEAHALMLEIVAEVEREARLRHADPAAALAVARRELELLSDGLSPFERLELLRDSAVEARVGALSARTLPLVRAVASGRVAREEVRQKGRLMAAEHARLERQARARGLDLEAELADVEVEIRFIVEGGAPGRRMR
jgi:heme exporter protein D